MKIKKLLLPLFIGLTTFSSAADTVGDKATRADIEIIKSSENIRVLSNEVMKDYILLYLGRDTKKDIDMSLSSISKELRIISKYTNKESTKTLVSFLSYNKLELEKDIKLKPTDEDILNILDYVEAFSEGSHSIFKGHKYEFSKNELMLMKSKDMSALLDEAYIYYFIAGLKSDEIHYDNKLITISESFTEGLGEFNEFKYPEDMKIVVSNLSEKWDANKAIFSKRNSILIPLILNDINENENNELQKLTDFHNKN